MAKDPYRYFRVEARDLLRQMSEAVLAAEQAPVPDLAAGMLRLAHTLKGAASVVRLPVIAGHAHEIEDLLTPLRDSASDPSREDLDALLALIDAAGAAVEQLGSITTGTATTATGAGAAATAGTPDASRRPGGDGAQSPMPSQSPSPSAPASASSGATVPTASTPAIDVADAGPQAIADDHSDAEDAALPLLEITQLVPEEIDQVLAGLAEAQAHVAVLQRALHRLQDLREQVNGNADGVADGLRQVEDQLERATRQIGHGLISVRDNAEQMRLIPSAQLFAPLQRAARDAGRLAGKRLQLVGRGGDLKLEGPLINAVLGALVQMVRNAVAHGIETPAARQAAGKPALGQIELRIERRGRQVLFACRDDGAGLDLDALRETARRKGIDVVGLDDGALVERLLRGGLSTAARVNSLAGRGVGMDLVRETADRLGGELSLHSRRGEGTSVELLLPLQMAAVRAVSVRAGSRWAWVPLDAVERVIQRPVLNGTHLAVGDELLPHLPLEEALRIDGADNRAPRAALVILAAGQRAALGVDAVDGVGTVVLRPPPLLAPDSPLVAGLALDADRQPLPVLAAEGLIEAARQARPRPVVAPPRTRTILVIDDSLTTRMLEQSILEAAGYRVHMAACAEDGLEAARRERYGLILVDVEMPGMDGFGFITEIRRDPALRDIPAVLVSSRNAPEDFERGRAVGADGYIVKSEFAQDEFLARVAHLLAHQRASAQEAQA